MRRSRRPLHTHTHESIAYVVKGKVKSTVGSEEFIMGPGDVCRHPKGVSTGWRPSNIPLWSRSSRRRLISAPSSRYENEDRPRRQCGVWTIRQGLLDDLRLARRRGAFAAGPDLGHRKSGHASERQLQNHLVMPETFAALDQSEVPDQAALSAAHSSQSDICETRHCAQHALPVSTSILDKTVAGPADRILIRQRRLHDYRRGRLPLHRRILLHAGNAARAVSRPRRRKKIS